MQVNYYEVLGCEKEASHEEIKRAYHERLLRFHPDKNDASKRDAHRFHEVQEAWRMLGDPRSRRRYDAVRRQEKLEDEGGLVYARLKVDELEESVFGDTLFYRCRCGDRYFVEIEDLSEKNSVLQVNCESCTFIILVET
ncbi:PREDICTED: dnaJ homolog subfamily C member 24-like [Dinoponera quadriceps]|uniref:DnaJ homolog subfamily C member 24-like n=1 Tax=Dinoponera quadriceps TaxID=609295 RepID=A0A6P3Y5I9_DINQU|nr:PREDICTED: dnaJ homolog subfamily C member 24-like [Dinoponera quadriceps]